MRCATCVTAPGELGFARAFVAGDIDVEGDIFDALALRDHVPDAEGHAAATGSRSARLVGVDGSAAAARRRPRRRGRAAGGTRKARDAAAIAHHYDVSNDFYRLVLGRR